MVGTILGSENTAVNKTDTVPALLEIQEIQKITSKKSHCVTQIYIIFICQSYLNRTGKKINKRINKSKYITNGGCTMKGGKRYRVGPLYIFM